VIAGMPDMAPCRLGMRATLPMHALQLRKARAIMRQQWRLPQQAEQRQLTLLQRWQRPGFPDTHLAQLETLHFEACAAFMPLEPYSRP